MFVATFALVCLCCVVTLLWIQAMESGGPSRRQLRQWRRDRLVLPRGNRRRS
jgi:hypothetical protein